MINNNSWFEKDLIEDNPFLPKKHSKNKTSFNNSWFEKDLIEDNPFSPKNNKCT